MFMGQHVTPINVYNRASRRVGYLTQKKKKKNRSGGSKYP